LIPDSKRTVANGATEENKARAEKKRRKSTRREEVQAAEGEGDSQPQEAGSRRRSGRIQKLQERKQNKLAGVDDDRSEGSDESEDEYEGSDGGDSDQPEAKENSRKRLSTWKPPSGPKRPRGSLPPQRKAKSLKGHRPNPKIFGQQVGTEVGDWWDSRMLCSQVSVFFF
jgi:hypothetical protein